MAKFCFNLLQAIRPDARRLRSLDFVDRQIHIPLVPDALFPLTLSLTLILLVCFSLLGRTWLASQTQTGASHLLVPCAPLLVLFAGISVLCHGTLDRLRP